MENKGVTVENIVMFVIILLQMCKNTAQVAVAAEPVEPEGMEERFSFCIKIKLIQLGWIFKHMVVMEVKADWVAMVNV